MTSRSTLSSRYITLGADKGFDAADFVMELREINVTPHIAQNASRTSTHDSTARSASMFNEPLDALIGKSVYCGLKTIRKPAVTAGLVSLKPAAP